MAGTKASGRPGGNPDFKNPNSEVRRYQYKPKRDEAFPRFMGVRMTQELYDAIRSPGKDYQDHLRSHLEKIYLAKKSPI